MPLPHPPGYQPPRQSQVDRRRVLLAAMVLAVLAVLLLVLGRRAAAQQPPRRSAKRLAGRARQSTPDRTSDAVGAWLLVSSSADDRGHGLVREALQRFLVDLWGVALQPADSFFVARGLCREGGRPFPR